MKRTYTPYWEWEDFNNGMWRKLPKDEEASFIITAIEFTGDYLLYGAAMGEVLEAWPNTMLNSLSNISINRKAFLGHCAACFKLHIPEYITRLAWKELTYEQRFNANEMARIHIKKWENDYGRSNIEIRKNLGIQMLLEWDTR